MVRRIGVVRLTTLLTMLLMAVLVTGCDGQVPALEPAPPSSTSDSPAAESPGDCLEPGDEAERVRFGPGGRLTGFILGEGERYVVLAHQSDANGCQMLPIGRGLTTGGYRVLALDFSGASAAEDLAQAVSFVRERGAESVSVVGASLGGLAALVVGAEVTPPLDAVVSLSAPSQYRGERAPSLLGFPSPLQVYVGRDDAGFLEDSRTFARQAPHAELFVLPVSSHGVALVDDAVFARIMEFLDQKSG